MTCVVVKDDMLRDFSLGNLSGWLSLFYPFVLFDKIKNTRFLSNKLTNQ